MTRAARVAVVVGNPKPQSRTLAAATYVATELGGGQPDLKGTYTGLLKLFLDRFATDGLRGVAVPLMLGGGPAHALAPELTLRPVLTEIGAIVPAKGLYVVDSAHDDPTAYAYWLELARPPITALLESRTGASS